MPPYKPITIAGGGLAGLSLGIALRRQRVPVEIFEAGSYPRHRVCGEFISGRGQEALARLGLPLMENGAREACTAAFFAWGMPEVKFKLPKPAICISRFILDDLLAREFRKLDGVLRERQRFQEQEAGREGLVHATGRHVRPVADGWRWYGLKVHAIGIEMQADQEVHVAPDGYIGLCRLKNEVNLCGLFRSTTTVPGLAHQWKERFRGEPGSELEKRLTRAEFDQASFCSVAGLDVEPRRIGAGERCELGDALTMIPPVTGNGMSMAFEAAELAVLPLLLYSRGDLPWKAAVGQVAESCVRRFQWRLKWAEWLHRAMFNRHGNAGLRWLLPRVPGVAASLFRKTR